VIDAAGRIFDEKGPNAMARKSPSPNPKRAAAASVKPKGTGGNKAAKTAVKKTSPTAGAAKSGPIALRNVTKRVAAEKNSDTLYIFADHEQLHISTEKPKAAAHIMTASSFDEAKEKAVDFLIEVIDNLERRLWEIKQASDLESLATRR
jgi:molecular chaperone GrpE (heat shock protein)